MLECSGQDRSPLSSHQILFIYGDLAHRIARSSLRAKGAVRGRDDAEEAHHFIFLRLLQRVARRWDRVRPLDAYIGKAFVLELKKFRQLEARHEIPQSQGDVDEV